MNGDVNQRIEELENKVTKLSTELAVMRGKLDVVIDFIDQDALPSPGNGNGGDPGFVDKLTKLTTDWAGLLAAVSILVAGASGIAAAITPSIVDNKVDAAVVEAVDETIVEAVEAEVQELVDETVVVAVEEAVDVAVATEVDETVADEIQDIVDEAVDDAVEVAVEDAVEVAVEAALPDGREQQLAPTPTP